MLQNLLLFGFFLFTVVNFLVGINRIFQPGLALEGLLLFIAFNLFLYFSPHLFKNIHTTKGSFFYTIGKNTPYRVIAIILLWVIAYGNLVASAEAPYGSLLVRFVSGVPLLYMAMLLIKKLDSA